MYNCVVSEKDTTQLYISSFLAGACPLGHAPALLSSTRPRHTIATPKLVNHTIRHVAPPRGPEAPRGVLGPEDRVDVLGRGDRETEQRVDERRAGACPKGHAPARKGEMCNCVVSFSDTTQLYISTERVVVVTN